MNENRRVLFISGSLARGGMQVVLVNIANVLSKNGYDVTILCYDSSDDDLREELDSQVKYIYKPRRQFILMNRIPHIRRYYNYRKAVWEHRASASSLYHYYIGNEKYDIEIAFYRGPSIKIISGSTNKKAIKLAWVHTDFKLCDKRSIMEWFNNMEEVRNAYQKMDKVVCVSNQAKKSFEEVIGISEKTVTVYNLIPSESIIKKSQEYCPMVRRKFTVVTVGRLIPDKRHDRLLYATKKLVEEGYDFDVWIIGSGRSEEELKAFCHSNQLNNVFFIGAQNNPYKYLKQADLFVLTSQREGFAIVIPEAMVCGLPVLSTRCTGPTEILNDGEYGILVDNSSNGIYNGLKSILDHRVNLEEYRKKSLLRYFEFDQDNILREIIRLFD